MSMDTILIDENYIPNESIEQKTIDSLKSNANTEKIIQVL
jgi:uncharacterized protein YegP (UPF0339 family)